MKVQKRTYKKNISYVEHKKNFPRTLTTFAKYNKSISIKYDISLKCWEFECIKWGTSLSSNKQIVYDPVDALESLRDINAIHEAIDGMFEYKKYANTIKDVVNQLQEKKNSDCGEVSLNTFFLKESSDIKSLLKSTLETTFQITLSEVTASKIYTSIMNRIRFKPIYCDENGKYYDYNSSQLDHFALCKSISHPKDFSTHEQIKKYYKIYTKYNFLFRDASSFKDLLSRDDSFSRNDPITKEWKEYYSFLKESKVFETLFYSMDFLEKYMVFFHDDQLQPVNLFSPKGKLLQRNVENYLKKILTKKSIQSINIAHFKIVYKALMEEIKDDWFNFLITFYQWPEVFGTYTVTIDKSIKFKKNSLIDSEPKIEEEINCFLPISFEKDNSQEKSKKQMNRYPEIPF